MSEKKLKPFYDAPKDIQKIIVDVLALETQRLDSNNPRLSGEVVEIVKTLVTEKDLDTDNEESHDNWINIFR